MVSVFLPLRGCGPLGWTNVSLVSGSRRAQVLFNKEGIIHELLVEAPLIRFSRMRSAGVLYFISLCLWWWKQTIRKMSKLATTTSIFENLAEN